MPARPATLLLLSVTLLSAADGAPDPAANALEQLHAANQARSELAHDNSTWTTERQRLEAVIAATRAETTRLERDAAAAETARDAARSRLAALGNGSDLDALRSRLAEAGARMSAQLAALARTVPPGAIPLATGSTGDDAFDAAVRTLDGAERNASGLAVEVITGNRDGKPEAVKILRVAGAVAWWVSLDGSRAGSVRMVDGTTRLEPSDLADRDAILSALAQAEGRKQPSITMLPGAPR
jgi:hypothetical protein